MTTKEVNIPDPDCYSCDGAGWYEGGEAIKTNCECLRMVKADDAEKFVTNGTQRQWKDLYHAALAKKG